MKKIQKKRASGLSYLPVTDRAREALNEYIGMLRASTKYKSTKINDELQMTRFKSHFPKPEDIIEAISDFATCVYAGEPPNPAVTVLIAEGFQRYLAGNGDISLDEAFGRKKRKGSSHPLKKKHTDDERNKHCFMMHRLIKDARTRGKKLSILAAAAQVKETLNLHKDKESLRTEYISNGGTEYFDDFFQFLRNAENVTAEREAAKSKKR